MPTYACGMTRHTLPRRRRAPFAVAAALLVSGLALAGCAPAPSAAGPGADPGAGAPPTVVAADELLGEFGLDGLDVVTVVDRLDTMPMTDRPDGLIASVRPDAVMFTAGERQAAMPLPSDEVYISIAPYVAQTHDCYFHSLTTCVGELQNTPVQLTLTDTATGKTLIEGEHATFDNGFIGVWVPRGIEAQLTIEHDGRQNTQLISTVNADDPTCITTLQLL